MQYTYDDGSTITVENGAVSSTPVPAGWSLSDYNENFTPGSVTSGAGSWSDVLKNGFGRVIDNAIARNTPQNTPATYNQAPVGGTRQTLEGGSTFMGISTRTLLLAGLLIGGAVVVAGMVKKD